MANIEIVGRPYTPDAQDSTSERSTVKRLLVSYLRDRNPRVSRNAAVALGALSDGEGLDILFDEAIGAQPGGRHSRQSAIDELQSLAVGPGRPDLLKRLQAAAKQRGPGQAAGYDLLTYCVHAASAESGGSPPANMTALAIRGALRHRPPSVGSVGRTAVAGGVVGAILMLVMLMPRVQMSGLAAPDTFYLWSLLYGVVAALTLSMGVRFGVRPMQSFPSLPTAVLAQSLQVGLTALALLASIALVAKATLPRGLFTDVEADVDRALVTAVLTGSLSIVCSRIAALYSAWRLRSAAGTVPLHFALWSGALPLVIWGLASDHAHPNLTRPGLEWMAVAALLPAVVGASFVFARIDVDRLTTLGVKRRSARWTLAVAMSTVAALLSSAWWWSKGRQATAGVVVDSEAEAIRLAAPGTPTKHRFYMTSVPVELPFIVEFGQKVQIDIPRESRRQVSPISISLLDSLNAGTRMMDFRVQLVRTSVDPVCVRGDSPGHPVKQADDPPIIEAVLLPGCYEVVVAPFRGNISAMGSATARRDATAVPGARMSEFLQELARETETYGPPFWVDITLNADKESPKSWVIGRDNPAVITDPRDIATWQSEGAMSGTEHEVGVLVVTKPSWVTAGELSGDIGAKVFARSARLGDQVIHFAPSTGSTVGHPVKIEPGTYQILTTPSDSRKALYKRTRTVSLRLTTEAPLRLDDELPDEDWTLVPTERLPSFDASGSHVVELALSGNRRRSFTVTVTRRGTLSLDLSAIGYQFLAPDLVLELWDSTSGRVLGYADDPERIAEVVDPGEYAIRIRPFDNEPSDPRPSNWRLTAQLTLPGL